MTVLVTGGAGYIGSHTVLALRAAGLDVVVIDDLRTGFDWLLPEDVPLIKGDIGDQKLVDETVKSNEVNSVIHFAGSVIVPESVVDPLKYYANNTGASRNLLEVCVKNEIRSFIFSSTAAIYGNPQTIPVIESAPLNPLSPYGVSKLMTELMLRDTAAAFPFFRFVALRYFNVAGADPEGRSGQSTKDATHLIKVACEAALSKRDHMAIFGTDYDTPDGTGVRDYIHVSDLASAHVLALQYLNDGGVSQIMNCGYGRGYSVREVIETVKKASGVDFPVMEESRRAGDSAQVVASNDRIRATLNWTPKHDDLEEIVRDALSWEKILETRNRI